MKLYFILCFIWFLSEVFLAITMRSKNSGKSEDRSSLRIIWITICVFMPIGVFLSFTSFRITIKFFELMYYTGIILIVLGILIRLISILTLKKAFTVNVAVSENQEIIQTGIYKFIRHPSYTGSLMSFFGVGIAVNNWLSLITICLPIYIAFYYRIVIEEKTLKNAFGVNYENYVKNTGKLFPKIL